MLKRLVGNVLQSAADAATIVTRETGANTSDFEGIKPVYIRFDIEPNYARLWPVNSAIRVSLVGKSSQEKVIWSYAIAAPGVVPCSYEFTIAEASPVLYDEEVDIIVESWVTGVANFVDYVMYYEVVKTTEMQMVQQIAMY